jgi:hypothetical protein
MTAADEGMMTDSTRVVRPASGRLRPTRTATAVIVAAALALLAAACSGSSTRSGIPTAAGESPSSRSAVGFSQCMRSHGVPSFPDPTSSGTIPKGTAQHFGVSDSRLQAGQTACAHLLPNSGG